MSAIIQEFVQAGLISESHLMYPAPAILVKKKDSIVRFIIVYEKSQLNLNQRFLSVT